MQFKSEFLKTLSERGFIHQGTDLEGLDALMAKESITAYIGFDCTAPSLHVGSLMQIMVLRWLQKTGHKPIVLMGGGTTRIGDPTGKDEARKILTEEFINANMAGIKKVFDKFITFGSAAGEALMVNNNDWLKELNYIDFLSIYGRLFSVNRMLTMDSVKLRLEREQHLSFLEFNYMLLQAYDFVQLKLKRACRLQIGGSDQWGNIVTGVDLWKKAYTTIIELDESVPKNKSELHNTKAPNLTQKSSEELFGLTTPLITTSSGTKMGKTEGGAVWLNADMCSPYDYWQFWRNTEDADVGRFLRFFTELPIREIEALEKYEGAKINEAKIILANEATTLAHGKQAALDAAETARKTFELGAVGDSLPEFTFPKSLLNDGSMNIRSLLTETKLAESGGDAKKLIQGNGVKINDTAVTDINLVLTPSHLNPDGFIKLSKGKKQHVIIRFS
jgi:tyrosyl-tRNA synthetase